MFPAAGRRSVSDRARRAWIALTVTGTLLLIAGVLTALAGLALAPGGARGTPAAVVAGQVLICCGLACGAGLLAAAALGLPGEGRRVARPVTGRLPAPRRRMPVPRWRATLRRPRPAGPAALRGPRRRGQRPLTSSGRSGAGTGPAVSAGPGTRSGPGPGSPAGPASGHGETSQDWIRSLRHGGPAG